MGTILASAITARAGRILFDDTHVAHPEAELLDWLNDGQRVAVIHKPDANSVVQTVQLQEGTEQVIPTDADRFIRLIRNMGADGLTPGRIIRQGDWEDMDHNNPSWHTDTADGEVRHYFYDARFPQSFFVWPPQPDPAHHVQGAFSMATADVDDPDNPITISDLYADALLNWMLFRAYSKDSKRRDPAKAASYYNLFATQLGIKERMEILAEPRPTTEERR